MSTETAPAAAPAKKSTFKHYDALDGLRAFAIIGVVLKHIWYNIEPKPEPNPLYDWLFTGLRQMNISLMFLMLAAFSMACGYYDKLRDGRFTPDSFYTKRYKRIWPFFALMVVVDVLATAVTHHGDLTYLVPSIYEAFADLTLCFGLLPNPDISVIGVGWFIGIVFLFYIMFPFFVFLIDNKRRAWFTLAIALLFSYVTYAYFGEDSARTLQSEFSAAFVTTDVSFKSMAIAGPIFLVGGLVFLYKDKIAPWVERHNLVMLAIAVAVTACYYLVATNTDQPFVILVMSALFDAAWISYGIGAKDRIMNSRFVKYVTKICMEIFLCHMFFFRAVQFLHLENHIANGALLYLVTLILTGILTVGFSHLIKFYIFPRLKIG